MLQAVLLSPGDALEDAFAVRQSVFVEEQGFSAGQEFDEVDPVAYHAVLYQDGRPVATGRLFADEQTGRWILGRIAVMPVCRGTGAGVQIMRFLEKKAMQLGAAELTLGAQCQARGFYEKLGYSAYGELYYDERCPHIHMKKVI